ncbi:MAG: hypothetical protein D6675_00410 [Gemmatimonadetes bacterium]|nr:MAG: hypothetical protein D6675_00410 [Gemmatimonadota bacterium]
MAESYSEAHLKILQMIEDGKISAEEGVKLLEALKPPESSGRGGGKQRREVAFDFDFPFDTGFWEKIGKKIEKEVSRAEKQFKEKMREFEERYRDEYRDKADDDA